MRLLLQAIYFVAMTAMVGVVGPFAGMGGPSILLKNVSRDRSVLSVYWGNGLVIALVSGAALSAVILACGPFFLGHGLLMSLLLVCVSDLLLIRVVELASFACPMISSNDRASSALHMIVTASIS